MSRREKILAAARESRPVVAFPVPERGITHLRRLSGAEMSACVSAAIAAAPAGTVTVSVEDTVPWVIALSLCDEDGRRDLGIDDARAFAEGSHIPGLRPKVLEINLMSQKAQADVGKDTGAAPAIATGSSAPTAGESPAP